MKSLPSFKGHKKHIAIMDWEGKEVYLKAYRSIGHAKKEIARFFDRYNTRRPHQGLNGRTPDEVYYETLPEVKEAV